MNIDIDAAVNALRGTAAPLSDWYAANARSMPWRDDPTPYHVWLSEIMLQQTRVEAVRGYYDRFLEAIPGVKVLAEAEEQALLKLWEGLGYYSRARNLQKAARVVMERHNGALPRKYEVLLSLPGIGEYTAGAIASIAFGEQVPAVDGNVLRVLSRLLASELDIREQAVKRQLRQVVRGIIPAERPGDFNQALMELGAVVCIPNGQPLCGQCPVSGYCWAWELGRTGKLPVKKAKKKRRVERRTVIYLISRGKVLLFQRKARLLHGMYEPLNLMGYFSQQEMIGYMASAMPLQTKMVPLGAAKHIFTHVEWRMTGYAVYGEASEAVSDGIWADWEEIREHYPIPAAYSAYTKQLPKLLCVED